MVDTVFLNRTRLDEDAENGYNNEKSWKEALR